MIDPNLPIMSDDDWRALAKEHADIRDKIARLEAARTALGKVMDEGGRDRMRVTACAIKHGPVLGEAASSVLARLRMP